MPFTMKFKHPQFLSRLKFRHFLSNRTNFSINFSFRLWQRRCKLKQLNINMLLCVSALLQRPLNDKMQQKSLFFFFVEGI